LAFDPKSKHIFDRSDESFLIVDLKWILFFSHNAISGAKPLVLPRARKFLIASQDSIADRKEKEVPLVK
jgi:hypothetical protein